MGPRELAGGLSWLPFAKYVVPEEAMKLSKLDGEEMAGALAWESVALALVASGPIFKSAGKGLNKLQKYVAKRNQLKIQPIEDAIDTISKEGVWKGFDYQVEATRLLKGQRFAKDEAEVIARVASGTDPVALKAIAWEKGAKLSGKWKKTIGQMGEDLGEAGLRKNLTLGDDLGKFLQPENVRGIYARKLYKDNLKILGPNASIHHTEAILKHQVGKLYGDDVAKSLDLGTVSDVEMANFISSMFEPKGRKAIGAAHRLALGEYRIPWARPERHVYGAGEAVFKTKTEIYDKLVGAQRAANGYKIDKMNTFMNMLEQRG
jgi:hypothetical protein